MEHRVAQSAFESLNTGVVVAFLSVISGVHTFRA
jgi:hypothetical protein